MSKLPKLYTASARSSCDDVFLLDDEEGGYSMADIEWWIGDICRLYGTVGWTFRIYDGYELVQRMTISATDCKELSKVS